MSLLAAIAVLVAFLIALLLHVLGAGYGELFVLIGLVCVGIWMVVQHVGTVWTRRAP
jgi:hypothetical protein